MNLNSPSCILLSSAWIISATMSSCVAPVPSTATTYQAGAEFRTLPPGYRTEIHGGTTYYVRNDTYYRKRSGRYVIVEAPRPLPRSREVYVERLPHGSRVVTYSGRRYYRVHDTYYQQRGAGYVVVGRPY